MNLNNSNGRYCPFVYKCYKQYPHPFFSHRRSCSCLTDPAERGRERWRALREGDLKADKEAEERVGTLCDGGLLSAESINERWSRSSQAEYINTEIRRKALRGKELWRWRQCPVFTASDEGELWRRTRTFKPFWKFRKQSSVFNLWLRDEWSERWRETERDKTRLWSHCTKSMRVWCHQDW